MPCHLLGRACNHSGDKNKSESSLHSPFGSLSPVVNAAWFLQWTNEWLLWSSVSPNRLEILKSSVVLRTCVRSNFSRGTDSDPRVSAHSGKRGMGLRSGWCPRPQIHSTTLDHMTADVPHAHPEVSAEGNRPSSLHRKDPRRKWLLLLWYGRCKCLF